MSDAFTDESDRLRDEETPGHGERNGGCSMLVYFVLFATLLNRWMRLDVASGLATFVGFTAAMWVFQRRSARVPQNPGRALTASLVSGIAAGVVAGGLAFLLPWR